jgi:Ribosomal protein L7/L12 C-terminal domain
MTPWLSLLGFAIIAGAALTSSFMSARTPSLDRRLARIERQLGLIMKRLEIDEPTPDLPGVVAELEQGNKIKAIKTYREQTGAGLAEAKAAVETIAKERGR